ncbi:ABC transporter ATP-binding protein [Desulfosporosinus nitroreducens]|uniref:ABC transporter ATP-binding protein n=1 Tax=Desulfosporosinus nitroreducens TaxID=2018668 RepID=A0ABT8QYJ0_9FIRM|nr:ABC transporter ATP-binding protein [Desulfosporosinus nitroreducens]MDO0825544.1 ABC transporter ATP-binding protein [Desulfosporosinus nitroreducens]
MQTKMDKIVKLSNIDKSYHVGGSTLQVLRQVSVNVEKGDFLAILGASGSGKSTLMNIIGCMDTADDGSYFLDDIEVTTCNDAQLTRLRNEKIGFVFQKYHLIPQYTILQNVILPLLIRGQSRRDAIPIAEEMIRMVGLEERLNHRPNELSGGQQQRVAIARALVTTPALLLADEPTGALDSQTSKEILSLFGRLNDMGNTIIMITHDQNVARYSKRVVYLNDGVLGNESVS